jgi:hypothetical protein
VLEARSLTKGHGVSVWEAQLLRVTFFPVGPVNLTAEWWTEFTGSEPEAVTTLPKEHVTTVSGPFAEAHLSLVSGPGRVDLLVQPAQPTAITAGVTNIAMPQYTAGTAAALLSTMASGFVPLTERMPLVQRIALGGTFLKETKSLEASYIELKHLLKSVAVRPEKMRELIYRVNWPVTIDGEDFNRLGTWASVNVKIQAIVPGAGSGTELLDKPYVSFEFDINTAPGPLISFGPERVRDKFSKLVGLLQENLERGEVPS